VRQLGVLLANKGMWTSEMKQQLRQVAREVRALSRRLSGSKSVWPVVLNLLRASMPLSHGLWHPLYLGSG
jgi:nitrate reductase assembly molybdenum cofactor insertion protein NarJ